MAIRESYAAVDRIRRAEHALGQKPVQVLFIGVQRSSGRIQLVQLMQAVDRGFCPFWCS